MTRPNDTDFSKSEAVPDYLIRHATLRQLQVFETIVRLGSFTRAAEELFLTQPTVSMQIKKLTDVVGLPLFEHVGRQVKPTEAGMELYAACQDIFASLSNLETKISDLKGIKRGRLRLGAITNAKYFAPELLGQFSMQYPGIEVALKVTNRNNIIERMRNNEDDVYIMGQAKPEDFEVEAIPIAPNPLVVLAPRDHPLVGQKNIPLARIVEEPFILREPGSGTRDAALRVFNAQKLQPQVRMELGSNEAIKHAIVGGLGISVLSLHTLTMEGANGPLAILDVQGFPIMRQWYLVYSKGKELSLVSKTFAEFAVGLESGMQERIVKIWPPITKFLKKTSTAKKTGKKSKKSSSNPD
jgi:DNA-binding transcriptional LysR family regulator